MSDDMVLNILRQPGANSQTKAREAIRFFAKEQGQDGNADAGQELAGLSLRAVVLATDLWLEQEEEAEEEDAGG